MASPAEGSPRSIRVIRIPANLRQVIQAAADRGCLAGDGTYLGLASAAIVDMLRHRCGLPNPQFTVNIRAQYSGVIYTVLHCPSFAVARRGAVPLIRCWRW
jgi:hypothetical protein